MVRVQGICDSMAISECPVCTFHIAVQQALSLGDVIVCPDCGARLKVAKVYPPVFEAIGEE
jgi:lysine biosynthesis protein LysW